MLSTVKALDRDCHWGLLAELRSLDFQASAELGKGVVLEHSSHNGPSSMSISKSLSICSAGKDCDDSWIPYGTTSARLDGQHSVIMDMKEEVHLLWCSLFQEAVRSL